MNKSPTTGAESVASRVQCTSCEAVCCRLTAILMPGDHVPEWLIEHDDHGMEILAKGEDGWCAALDPLTMRCTIYADRPGICRKFAMGGPGCREERRKWYGDALPAPTGSG